MTLIHPDAVRDMEQNMWHDLAVLRHGGNPSRKRKASSAAADERIMALTNDLDAGRISIRSFLRRTSYAITNAYMKGLNGERYYCLCAHNNFQLLNSYSETDFLHFSLQVTGKIACKRHCWECNVPNDVRITSGSRACLRSNVW